MFHGVFEPSFPLSCCLVFRLCEAVFCVPPLRGRGSRLCERRSLMQIPRETLLHKSRSVVKFCDILSIQLARVVSPLSRG